MTTLPDFEHDAREALLNNAENALYAEPDNLAFRFLRSANENFREYASRHDYDIDAIPDSGQVTDTQRSNRGVSATVEWPHRLTALFEFGVTPHVIEGNPRLAFSWPSPPSGTRPQGAPSFVSTDKVNWGSVTGGIPESRSIRGALQLLRLQLEGEVSL